LYDQREARRYWFKQLNAPLPAYVATLPNFSLIE
jgi:hypothetical protein